MAQLFTLSEDSIRRVAREVFAAERNARSWFDRAQQTQALWSAPPLPTTMRFRNDSGEEIPAFGVMRVTGIETVGGRASAIVAKPSSSFERLYLVNTYRVAADGIGEGTWLSEANYVLYNTGSGTPAYGESWGPKSGQWTLEKYYYGFTILGGNTSGRTGAIQHQVNGMRGVTDAAIAKDATGTVSILDGNGAGVDTGWNITARNRYANVAITKDVDVVWRGGSWDMVAAECA